MSYLYYPFQTTGRSLLKSALFTTILLLFQWTVSAQTPNCNADAGTLDALDVCLLSDQTILKATNRGDTTVPQDYQVLYLLTHTSALIVEQVSNAPVFTLPGSLAGIYTIHTLVYNPNTLNLNTIILGQTTGFEINTLLLQGGGTICAALDVRGAKVRFGTCEEDCIATAGSLKATSNNCLRDGNATLNAAIQYAPIIPPGFSRAYVLTQGDNLVIEQISTTPSFVGHSTGKYTIHTLVYDAATLDLSTIILGQTTASAVNALLLQGGGTICAALDLVGAPFNVTACPPLCTAQAGKLQPDNDPCLRSGKATLVAKLYQNSIIPQGYQVRYLLTSGYGLVIQQISTTPSFIVNTTGLYTIHTLVYNPNTLNLNNIQLGATQLSTVDSWILHGGGSICAALDLIGATFDLKVCPPPACNANAGKLKPDNDPCLEDGKATLKAKFYYNPSVPYGYRIRYLLTSGNNLVIEQTSYVPSFMVYYTGKFSIHALVYDPNTLDIDEELTLGVTTAFDLQESLVQGGGYICAALDMDGAAFYIQSCNYCLAKAGKLKPTNEPCLVNDTTTLKAQTLVAPVVPTGYAVRYLLATPYGYNQVIRKISKTPSFLVSDDGQFTIHTLVYDSTTLHLNSIQLNSTTIQQVDKWLIQGGGIICGALDLDGAKFNIKDCNNICSVKAGTLVPLPGNPCVTPNVSMPNLIAYHSQSPITTSGYKIIYLLSFGNNLVIEQINLLPNFKVNKAGTFHIHTLVYDPNTLDISDIQASITRISTVNQWLKQGGGTICGALDVQGAAFQVSTCNNFNTNAKSFNAYPNPTTGLVSIDFDKPEKVETIRVELLDVSGNVRKTWAFDGEQTQATLDISEVNAGLYNIRLVYDNAATQNIRVAKAAY